MVSSTLRIMSRWLSNPGILLEQGAAHREFAERGDLAGLARSVMEAACNNGSMTGPGVEAMAWLRQLPDRDRLELAGIWSAWHARTAADAPSAEVFRRNTSYLRAELLLAATGVARGLDPDLMAAERRAVLGKTAGDHVASGHREWELAEAELEAGRVPGPEVLAVFRRTVIDYHAEPALRELLTRFPGPVLNPGEAWADQALEDAARGGDTWHRLLAHRAPLSAGAPSAKWLDTGRDLLDAAGPEPVRRRVHQWFELVGRERPVPLRGSQGPAAYDPYNVQALRALAWLLSLLPPRDDTCDALARLVETSLRRLPYSGLYPVRVAEAGVVALARIGTGDARRELDGLRRRVTHKTVLRRVDRALAA
ncbi:predicted protein [Streptomyces pristinaespiralis ATCC 25486]|uniref:Predicted protein n=2 Tax=Streptomyces pristinaespiralis TaxID=38300 RepID=D6X966_STRE2|nr:predicted protein [Streptomyces pristinaespiralis ATCC 25486]